MCKKLTRRELPSIHHLLRFVECCTSPARVETIADEPPTDVCCRRPGPSFRFTCWAGTFSPGRIAVMVVKREVLLRARARSAPSL